MMKKPLLLLILIVNTVLLLAQNIDYKVIPLPNNDILFAPIQKRIYASVPSSIPQYGNSICRINPNFGTIEASIWVGSEPTKLALSDDEKYLYIGFNGTSKIKRLNLLTNQIEQEVFFANDNVKDFFGYVAGDIAVMPKHPNTYVVARQSTIYSPSYAGVVVMDGIKRRTKIVEGYNESNNLLFVSDTSTLWGIGDAGTWYKLKIDTSGIEKVGTYNGAGYATNLHYSPFDSLYYASDGYRFDLRGGTPIGKQFANSPGYSLADPLNANIYYLTTLNEGVNIKIYNRKTQIPIDQFTLPIPIKTHYIAEALNWGTSGQIALRGINEIVILNPCLSKAPKPVITEGVRVTLCPNREVTLTASGNASRYYWSTGDSTKTIKVKDAGAYSVGIADSLGCLNYSLSTELVLSQQPSTPSISYSSFDEPLCMGVTAKLVTGYFNDPNKFEWSNGKMGQFIEVTQPIQLTVVAISPEGCRSFLSDPFNVKFLDFARPPKPSIAVVGDTAVCADDGLTKLSTKAGYKQYKWSTGQETPNITVTHLYTQKFWLRVIDENGCQSLSSDTVSIRIKDTPFKPSISKNGNVLSVFYDSGIQWFFNGEPINGATQRNYTALVNGFYSVQFTNAQGCISEMSNLLNITNITAINNLEAGQKFDVFPNPIQDILTINTEGVEQATITLTDSYGRIIWTLPLKNKRLSISIPNVAAGIYTLSLKNTQGFILSIKKIVKI